jgi:hypothetical protein
MKRVEPAARRRDLRPLNPAERGDVARAVLGHALAEDQARGAGRGGMVIRLRSGRPHCSQ